MKSDENSLRVESRRSALSKAGKMIIPTLVTFHVASLKACPSGVYKKPGETSNDGNNGNHYGNEKPDGNPKDWKNQYDGSDNPHGRRNRSDTGKPSGNQQSGKNQHDGNHNSNGQGNSCENGKPAGNQQNWRSQYAGYYNPRGRRNR